MRRLEPGGTTALLPLPQAQPSPELHKHPLISASSFLTPSSCLPSSSGVNASHETALTAGLQTKAQQHICLTPLFYHHGSGQAVDAEWWLLLCCSSCGRFCSSQVPHTGPVHCKSLAIRPTGGQAAAGVRIGMNYGCAGLLGEQRALAAGYLLLQRRWLLLHKRHRNTETQH